MIPLNYYLVLGVTLFSIGLYGVLSKKNMILVLISLEIMLNAVNLNLVSFSRYVSPELMTGQLYVVFVIVATAAEIGVGLAILLSLFRQRGSLETDQYNNMKW